MCIRDRCSDDVTSRCERISWTHECVETHELADCSHKVQGACHEQPRAIWCQASGFLVCPLCVVFYDDGTVGMVAQELLLQFPRAGSPTVVRDAGQDDGVYLWSQYAGDTVHILVHEHADQHGEPLAGDMGMQRFHEVPGGRLCMCTIQKDRWSTGNELHASGPERKPQSTAHCRFRYVDAVLDSLSLIHISEPTRPY